MSQNAEHIPKCYGKMFPPLSDRSPNQAHQGHVFGFFIRSYGLMPSGQEAEVDEKAWKECIQCPHYRTCYDLSLGRLQMEAAVAG